MNSQFPHCSLNLNPLKDPVKTANSQTKISPCDPKDKSCYVWAIQWYISHETYACRC